MKVCFYFDNRRKSNIDFSNPSNGNPGIGGTEYMIWTVSYYLNNMYDDIEVVMLAPIIGNLPKSIKSIKCCDEYEAVEIAKKINIDILVLRGAYYKKKDLYELIDKYKINTVMWCHNFEEFEYLKLADECKYVKRNICVSREQYDRLRDHSIFKKSIYIYNSLDFSIYSNVVSDGDKENIVCYLGAIRPKKGFDKLAEIWSKIEEAIPDAKLYVIGSGKLYNTNIKLGKYNIAEEEYENMFINHLIDDNGEIKNNIKFWGDLGHEEKLDVMSKSKVGIVNPVAKDETFCISAIEFEALGIPVIAKKTFGLLNTVSNGKSGVLIKNDKELINSIVELLKNKALNKSMGQYGKRYVTSKFDIYSICDEWRKCLYEIKDDKKPCINLKTSNYLCDLKWLREINRLIKKVPIFNKLPAVAEYPDVIYSLGFYKKLNQIKEKLRI